MSNLPLVSVIVPVYQVEKYIANCINSIINQTYKNIELIIVNDGSTDNSIQIAKDLLNGAKVDYKLINQENKGQGKSRNVGLEHASGEWILFVDSDDLLSTQTIEILIKQAIETNSEIAISNFITVNNINEIIEKQDKYEAIVYSSSDLQKDFLLRKIVILAPGTLYNKSFLDKYSLKFNDLKWSEDQEFVWRLLFHINKAVYIDKPLYFYNRHTNSIMNSTKLETIVESYETIEKLEDYYGNNNMAKLIVSRWVMGTLNSTTVTEKYDDWKSLVKFLDSDKHFKNLFYFPSIKVKIMSTIGLLSKRVYFFLNKSIKEDI